MKKLPADVRTREEFVMEHVAGAINIPHYDLEYYQDLLRGHDVVLYCNTGKRAAIAARKLAALGIPAEILPVAQAEKSPKQGKTIVCAINYVSPRPNCEKEFMAKASELCHATEDVPGFLGSKIMKLSGISAAGSYMAGDTSELRVEPPPTCC